MEISVKVVRRGKDVLVSACDAELLGKTLKFGRIDFPVRREFYEGQFLSPEATIQEIRNATTANLLGKKTVEHALKAGLIHPGAVLNISGIPHAMILKI
jgi:hypothetical protein